ncbi:hypothetical protein CIK04_05345 [Vibrio sp. 03_296]|uniref:DUF3265 domain-containing protein n=1 Tax=Vibrio vulnificus TaxID=672 RepID=A0ABX4WVS7_VIBVL|nr:hypothetical protein CIK04_23615 [Vibrio sp. 03_296]PJO14965.1 hypothetical protein COO31_000940 [Vibrio vulnificus]OZT85862.1 hypothetical protein CIK04_05345 [Vibrio sp. 03_296]PNM66955.1 hypothetical protein AL548_011845 [Vibrio vulnificus]POB92253.1 hypothetical protein CRN57_19120 [Vibrio vulnificus]
MDTLCLFNDIFLRMAISFLLEAAAVLAAFVHTNHIGYLCSWDSLICRLPATSSCLGIFCILSPKSKPPHRATVLFDIVCED